MYVCLHVVGVGCTSLPIVRTTILRIQETLFNKHKLSSATITSLVKFYKI